MADVITLRGTTIFTSATTGVEWKFSPGSIVEDAIEERARIGDGYWVKPAGLTAASHQLDLGWVTSDPAATKATVDALARVAMGNLVLPIWGTYANCRLANVSWEPAVPLDGGLYGLRASLSITQYP